ncbi:hypothetical protein HPB47_009342 [Ixodes persulcatus]|uniref:Uncharacterized protein n=1 Tax=Ixodes persulcatus TaxID=34615 RepID=A0AC60P2D0_IXOPE|nr:hypothetical protein HPB47_009342 [Ixodes persulcatus]
MNRERGDAAEPINKSGGDSSLASTSRCGTPMPPRKRRSASKKEDLDPRRIVISWIRNQIGSIQPWKPFLDTAKLSVPKSAQELGHRVHSNLDKYRSNYELVFVAFFVCCVLASPGLFVGVVGCAGLCWVLKVHQDDDSAPILNTGVVLTKAQRAACAASVVLPILYVADGWTAAVWSLAACVLVTLLHAGFHEAAVSQELEDIPEEADLAAL